MSAAICTTKAMLTRSHSTAEFVHQSRKHFTRRGRLDYYFVSPLKDHSVLRTLFLQSKPSTSTELDNHVFETIDLSQQPLPLS